MATCTARTAGPDSRGLTAVDGLRVGSVTLTERPTGCTVILVEGEGAVGGVSQRGGAPGTRETDLLDPGNMVDKVNAVVLSGGSAFGLDAATGTVRWLEEQNMGWDVRIAKVPIVPAAILFDLPVGGNPKVRPTADCGYKAAAAATSGPVQEGSIGAGAGATVGKIGRPGAIDEGRPRQLRHRHAQRPGRGGHRRRERRRRHHRPRHRPGSSPACATADGTLRRRPTCCCAPARRRRRRGPARTRPSAWSPPTPG